MKKRSILQVFYILSRKEYRYTKSFWQIADVWPPEGTNCSSFPKQLQTQPHCPKFLCHMLPQGPIYSLITQSSLVLTIKSHHLYTEPRKLQASWQEKHGYQTTEKQKYTRLPSEVCIVFTLKVQKICTQLKLNDHRFANKIKIRRKCLFKSLCQAR